MILQICFEISVQFYYVILIYVNYGILSDTHDDNTLAAIVEALILWGVTKQEKKDVKHCKKTNTKP